MDGFWLYILLQLVNCNMLCLSLVYTLIDFSTFTGITVHLKFPYSRNCDEEHLYLDIVTHTVTRLTDRGAQYASMKRPEPAQAVAYPVSNVTQVFKVYQSFEPLLPYRLVKIIDRIHAYRQTGSHALHTHMVHVYMCFIKMFKATKS